MNKNRLSFVSILCITLLFINSLLLAQSHSADSPEPNAVMVVGPYLQAPTENSMTVMWLTDERCTAWVEYGTDKDNLDQKAYDETCDGLINAYVTTHKIKLNNLKPGTQYFYRVRSEEILEYGAYYDKKFSQPFGSDTYSFKTSSKDTKKVSVVCFNKLLSKLLEKAAAKPFDAVFMNGDIMEALYDTPAQVIKSLLKPCVEQFATEIPFCYARGNHETRASHARYLKDYLDSPGPGNFYYAFTYGPVHFVVLDGGEDKVDSHPVYANLNVFDAYRTQQAQWLAKHVQTAEYKNAKWRVLVSHMPFESTAGGHGVKDATTKFMPHLQDIDISIAGHTHRFRIVEPSENQPYPIIVGGNNREEGATIIRLEATRDEVNVSVTNYAGEEIGTYQLKK